MVCQSRESVTKETSLGEIVTEVKAWWGRRRSGGVCVWHVEGNELYQTHLNSKSSSATVRLISFWYTLGKLYRIH